MKSKGWRVFWKQPALSWSRHKNPKQPQKRDKEVRQDLFKAVSKVRRAHAELDESSTSSTASVKKAENDLEKAQSDSTKAEAGRVDAESVLNLRRADF